MPYQTSQVFADDVERIKFAMNAAGIGVWEVDIPNKQVIWDKRCSELFGLPNPCTRPYEDAFQFVHPEDVNRVKAAFENALHGVNNGLYDTTCRTISSDKTLRWVNFTGTAYVDTAGQTVRFGGVARDVTCSQLARKKSEASEARFQHLVHDAAVGIVLLMGNEMVVALANDAYAKLIDHTVPEIMNRPIFDVIPDAEAFFRPILETVRATGQDYHLDDTPYSVKGADGQTKAGYLRATYQAYREESGDISGVMVVAHDVTEQVTARKKIQESEAFRELLSNSVPAMIFYMDAEHRYTSYNDTFMKWYNVDATEAIGKKTREFIGEAAYARIAPHLAKAFAGERVLFEMPAPTRISADRWLSIVYTPHKTSDGSVQGVIVHATDITQTKRTELALREGEARFRAIFEQGPIATCLFVGREMKIEVANQLMLDAWGKSAEVIGKPFARALPERITQPFLENLDEVFMTGKVYTGIAEETLVEADGILRSYYYDYTFQPVFDDAGEVYAVMNMAINVTDRVAARKKAEETNAIIHDAVELAALETWTLDATTQAFAVSARLRGWLGYTPEDPLYTESLFAKPAEELLADVLATPAGRLDVELTVESPATGQKRILHVQGQMLYDNKGRARQLRGMALDITMERGLRDALEREVILRTEELQAANEALQSTNEELYESNQRLTLSNEELSQYAYIASHDLQEPLRKIHFFSERIARSEELSASNTQLMHKVMSSATRMTTLIQAVLEYSRLQRQHSDLEKPVDLNTVVHAVVNDFELMIEQKRATLKVGELPTVKAVGLQMNQLFYNLIGNSLKFTKPDGDPLVVIESMALTQEQAAEHIQKPDAKLQYHHITLSDNGIGFEQNFAEQIFDVFKRLHGRGSYPGSGIGLALCRRIIRNHGGALYAIGNPGQGSVFHIILPEKKQ